MKKKTIEKAMKGASECGTQHKKLLLKMTWWLPDEAATDPDHPMASAWDHAVREVASRYERMNGDFWKLIAFA